MTTNKRNQRQKRQAAFTKWKPNMVPVSETEAKPGEYEQLFPHLKTHVHTSKSGSKSRDKHDSDGSSDYFSENEANIDGKSNESVSDSEESSAHESVALKSTHSADARKVFDEKPDRVADLVVEQPKAHWTCYAKLHSIPVQGNRVKLEAKHIDNTTWGFCLVGHFAPKFQGEQGIVQLCDSWNVPYKSFDHATGWRVFKFEKAQHREQVLLEGPYSVCGSTLLLKHMPPCFEFDSNPFRFIPVWIKLHGLPLDCWDPTALSMIASAVGKPISTDKRTHTKEMISYARVLVEVDASAELVSSIEIHLPNGRVRHQDVEFDFVPKYCVLCQHLGHSSRICPEKIR